MHSYTPKKRKETLTITEWRCGNCKELICVIEKHCSECGKKIKWGKLKDLL